MLLIIAVDFPIAQDWTPFHVASRLAAQGQWDDLYITRDAVSLFDVSARYRDSASEIATPAGVSAIQPGTLTAFVSPPPAALLLMPLRRYSWHTSMVVMRLALVLPLCAGLLVFGEVFAGRRAGLRLRWAFICALSVMLLAYTVAWGQPTAWLVAAALISVMPASLVLDVVGGALLALGVVTKATPAIVVVGLFLVGRRRLAIVAFAIAAVAACAALPLTGVDAWRLFAESSARLSRGVITDWSNASVDALILRSALQVTDGVIREPTFVSAAVSWLVRIGLLGAAVWSASRTNASPERRAAAVWVAWLAATPLLWLHYLCVLLPLIGCVSARHAWPALLLAGGLFATTVVAPMGWRGTLMDNVACLVWVATACWLLHGSPWTAGRDLPKEAV